MPEARCGLDTLERDALHGGISVRAKSIDSTLCPPSRSTRLFLLQVQPSTHLYIHPSQSPSFGLSSIPARADFILRDLIALRQPFVRCALPTRSSYLSASYALNSVAAALGQRETGSRATFDYLGCDPYFVVRELTNVDYRYHSTLENVSF
ncbi:hypothetical protein PM082_020887 [Marasmius tenuissimus]|nr:hypothetical protein PM082_020887 [Marasmius tenuissimus]